MMSHRTRKLCLSTALLGLVLGASACIQNPPKSDEPSSAAHTGSSDSTPSTMDRTDPPTAIDPGSRRLSRAELSGFGTDASDEINSTSITSLDVRTGRGTVTITGDPMARSIRASAKIRSWAETYPEAERIVREIAIRFIARDTENPSLIVPEPDLTTANQDYECDLTIVLPPSVRVSLDNNGGDAAITGLLSGLKVVHNGGELTIQRVQGGVEVDNRGTAAHLTELTGLVQVRDRSGDLTIGFVTGEVLVEDNEGDLTIHSVTGNVTARNNTGTPRFQNIDGDLTLVGIAHNRAVVEGVSGSVVYPSSH
ncbi:MAG: hypothetical protein KDC38_02150 [Planctomycetes bacterium]|nr:hypothetical protein [Planctomycetota bacterium]